MLEHHIDLSDALDPTSDWPWYDHPCTCADDPTVPHVTPSHDCICESGERHPLCRRHGHEDVAMGTYDTSEACRRNVDREMSRMAD